MSQTHQTLAQYGITINILTSLYLIPSSIVVEQSSKNNGADGR
jgi:hypothetical protein